MAVKIRMKKFGRKNRPEFRIVATDTRSPRDGSIIENLGFYHPLEKEAEKVLRMNDDRVKYWLSVGAQPSETLVSILKRRGIAIPWVENTKVKRAKFFAERRAKKGKPPRAAKAKGEARPKPAAAAATATGAATAPPTDEKVAAAKSKAAKREAKKAK
jgi:small subunit ribosomal protein S16